MSDWRGEDGEQDLWPVQYPVDRPPREASGRFRRYSPPRWAENAKTDTGQVRRRLLWILLAVEIGMVVAAGCVLPLAFVNVPLRQEGVVGAIVAEMGRLLDVSSQAACLIMALPIPILAVVLGANLWLYRWLRRGRGS